MTEETLRRWVRRELPATERREVTRWIVRCSAPELGPLLHAMAVEARDEAADATLAARGPWSAWLVARWNQLLDAGAGALSTGEPRLVFASVAADEAPSLAIEATDAVRAQVRRQEAWSAGARMALYLTDDSGRVLRLHGPGPTADVDIPLPDVLGSRTTIWLAVGPTLADSGDPAADLEQAGQAAELQAVRYDP